jgi:folate-dependent phosphoribosylglycinamide formyltransferase PurN
MSGSGTNAENLLESLSNSSIPSWRAAAILTDAPEKSRARQISSKYGIPLVEHDIKKFYAEKGEQRVGIMTERGKILREEWTDAMRKLLSPFNADFGILAGFVPLSNICADFPCLNVHPGDLTVERNGCRLLVGLHTAPVEIAIINGFPCIRSSVIAAQPYTGSGGEMDSGPILGISRKVEVDLMGRTVGELKILSERRPEQRPSGGFKDTLEEIAKHNQDRLKEHGDWTLFPAVVDDFAKGAFKKDSEGNLLYFDNAKWNKVKTVVYDDNGKTPSPLCKYSPKDGVR